MWKTSCLMGVVLATGWIGVAESAAAARGTLHLSVTDQATGEPLAVRMYLKNERGRTIHPPRTVWWKDHFVVDGAIDLELLPGSYTFEMERGPEYKLRTGNFTIESGAEDTHGVVMERFVDMKKEGWWSGELHIHRPPADMEFLMKAEDLHVGPVITWWNKRNAWADQAIPDERLVRFDGDRYYHVMAGEDERGGGALMFFNLDKPLEIADAEREYPCAAAFQDLAARDPQAHIDVEKPFWWDMPVWVANGPVHSMGLAHNHMWRDGVLATEAWGKPRDKTLYPDPHGNARWSIDIYYHLLNCGLRIPPSAGSASGVLPNPVGYNRVYVYCGDDFTYENWWEGLRAGRVVVTNGPLIRPHVNGKLPGHVFQAQAGQEVTLDIALKLSTREKIEYLEIIKNGQVHREVRLDEYARSGGRLPKVTFDESGWMLIRAVTNQEKTYRFASTGPYYVEIGNQPRISKRSAQFFVDWVYERARQIKLDDAEKQEEVMAYHRKARDFWEDLARRATTE